MKNFLFSLLLIILSSSTVVANFLPIKSHHSDAYGQPLACWICITSDISGGWSGGSMAAAVAPHPLVVMGGAVIGSVGSSIAAMHSSGYGSPTNTPDQNPIIITSTNEYDVVGVLRNKILSKFADEDLNPLDVELIISESINMMHQEEIFSGFDFPEEMLNIMRLYLGDIQNYNNQVPSDLLAFIKDIRSDFENGVSIEVLSNKVSMFEVVNYENEPNLFALAVLKYSHGFWNF